MAVDTECLQSHCIYETFPITPMGRFVIQAALEQTEPLMMALQEEYRGERGWRLCGPASIVDGIFLSARTGLPFGLNARGRHFEIQVGLHTWMKGVKDHASLAYVDRRARETIIIDRVGELLLGHAVDPMSATSIQIYQGDTAKIWLYRFWTENIREYQVGYAAQNEIDIWGEGHPTTAMGFRELMAAIHSREILFQDEIETASGKVYDISDYWGARLMRVIRSMHAALPPEIQPPLEAVLA